jgi:hypothetical protein
VIDIVGVVRVLVKKVRGGAKEADGKNRGHGH